MASNTTPSTTTALALNLRHCSVSLRNVRSLPSELETLFIGPLFSNNLEQVVQNLPTHVLHLDLDLTNTITNSDCCNVVNTVLKNLLQRLQRLESLSLRLLDESGIQDLASALPGAHQLRKLDLRNNEMGSKGAQSLFQTLRQNQLNITHLNLSWNELRDEAVVHIAELLQSPSCTLQHLDISHNPDISKDGFLLLIRALHQNHTLREINFSDCRGINEECVLLLLETTLHNHTLYRCRLPAQVSSQLVVRMEYQLSLNRAGRQLLRKSARIPVALWAYVLERSSRQGQVYFQNGQRHMDFSPLYFMVQQKSYLMEHWESCGGNR